MNANELWLQFIEENNVKSSSYEAWAFGGELDSLAKLVVEGKKIATASLMYWYENEDIPLPKAGSYSVILDSKDDAKCIIQTTKVYVVPFNSVTKEHAQKEGEGDLSLSYWREVHREFFSSELKSVNKSFSELMDVVCEEFKLVYLPK